MAIVNLTPDSFYSSSRHSSYREVCKTVERAIVAGATISTSEATPRAQVLTRCR